MDALWGFLQDSRSSLGDVLPLFFQGKIVRRGITVRRTLARMERRVPPSQFPSSVNVFPASRAQLAKSTQVFASFQFNSDMLELKGIHTFNIPQGHVQNDS